MKISEFEHKRLQNRVRSWDYSENGYYFVTVCTKNFVHWFGEVKNGKMELNEFGKIVKKQLIWLEINFQHIELDYYVIMPNHVHAIIVINKNILNNFVVNGLDRSLQNIKILSLSNIIGAFKTTSSKLIHLTGTSHFCWQKSFYDHVIRKEESLDSIRKYIFNNPLKWHLDKNNPERKPGRYHFEF